MRDPREEYYDAVRETVEQMAAEMGVPLERLTLESEPERSPMARQLPKPPPAGLDGDIEKWNTLTRAERRELTRMHRRRTQ